MKIIIVDDNEKETQHIKALLYTIIKRDYQILTYSQTCENLIDEIKMKDTRKIYILNIETGDQTSGITIAKKIRETDFDSEIIFITKHEKMFEVAHRSVYKVFDFIEKFHEFDKRFKKDIRDIVNMEYDDKIFRYKDLILFYKSILYIYRETEERKLVIVTKNGTYRVKMSIKKMLSMLDERFVQCHRSCIMNVLLIEDKNYKEGYFKAKGEAVYLLSKKFKKDIDRVTNDFFN